MPLPKKKTLLIKYLELQCQAQLARVGVPPGNDLEINMMGLGDTQKVSSGHIAMCCLTS